MTEKNETTQSWHFYCSSVLLWSTGLWWQELLRTKSDERRRRTAVVTTVVLWHAIVVWVGWRRQREEREEKVSVNFEVEKEKHLFLPLFFQLISSLGSFNLISSGDCVISRKQRRMRKRVYVSSGLYFLSPHEKIRFSPHSLRLGFREAKNSTWKEKRRWGRHAPGESYCHPSCHSCCVSRSSTRTAILISSSATSESGCKQHTLRVLPIHVSHSFTSSFFHSHAQLIVH